MTGSLVRFTIASGTPESAAVGAALAVLATRPRTAPTVGTRDIRRRPLGVGGAPPRVFLVRLIPVARPRFPRPDPFTLPPADLLRAIASSFAHQKVSRLRRWSCIHVPERGAARSATVSQSPMGRLSL